MKPTHSSSPLNPIDPRSQPAPTIPLNTRDLLIQVLAEKKLGAFIDTDQKNTLQKAIRDKINTKINQYQNPIVKLIVRIWYCVHSNILETELKKVDHWIHNFFEEEYKPLVIEFQEYHGKTLHQEYHGKTLLHYVNERGYTEIALALINKMNPNDLAIKDDMNKTALMHAALQGHKEIALALINKMNPNDLAIKNDLNKTALIYATLHGHTEIALALIKKMKPQDLAIRNNEGDTALDWAMTKGHTDIALALIDKMNPNDLAIKDYFNKTALIHATLQGHKEIALALIDKMNPNDLAIRDNKGDTALDWAMAKGHTEIALAFINKINPEADFPAYHELLQGIYDKELPDDFRLLSSKFFQWISVPRYLRGVEMNPSWLAKPKNLAATTTPIVTADYVKRMDTLNKNVLQLWNDLKIGNDQGEVLPKSLGRYDKQEIMNALQAMLDKMTTKSPWLGTPQSTDLAGLDQFYTEMLTNFESVVEVLLRKNDPEQTFSSLFGIAQAQLEGRCAAAYQSEILQAKSLLGDQTEEMSVAASFNAILNNILNSTIEKIVREKFDSDSHAYAQLAYFVGLSSVQDSLSNLEIEKSFSLINEKWNPSVLDEFEKSLKKIDKNLLFDWFKDQTPVDIIKPLMLQTAKQFEAEQIKLMSTKLEALPLDPEDRVKITQCITQIGELLPDSPRPQVIKELSTPLSEKDYQQFIAINNEFVTTMARWDEEQEEGIQYTPSDPSGVSFSVSDEDVRRWYAGSFFEREPYQLNEKGVKHIISFTGVAKFPST